MFKFFVTLMFTLSSLHVFGNSDIMLIPVKEIPKKIDSFYGNDLTLNKIINQLAEGLVKLDDSLYPRPAVAKSWKIDERNKSIEFSLDTGKKFHDGSTVKSIDVFNVLQQSLAKKSDLTSQISEFESCKTMRKCEGFSEIDQKSFKLKLNDTNFIGFLRKLSNIEGVIFKRDSSRFIGTGPYKLEKLTKSQVVLNRVSKSYFKKIIFKKMNDKDALKSFLAGKVDFISDSDFKVSKSDLNNPLVKEENTVLTFGLVFNLKKGVFKSKHNRKVLSVAIDKEKLVKLYSHPAIVANGLIPKGFQGHVRNTEKSKGFGRLKLYGSKKVIFGLRHKYKGNKAITDYLPRVMKSLGLDVKVVFDDFGAILKDLKKPSGKYHLTIKGEAPRYFDSASVFRPYVYGQFPNVTNYKNDEFTKLYFDSESLLGKKKLMALGRMEEILREEVPVIPLFHPVFTKWYQSSMNINKDLKSSIKFWDFPFYSYSRNKINTEKGGRL